MNPKNSSSTSAELATPPFNRDDGSTSGVLTFWYMIGPGHSIFQVSKVERAIGYLDSDVVIANVTLPEVEDDDVHRTWHLKTVPFCVQGNEILLFRVIPGINFTFTALDEVLSYNDGSGKTKSP